MDTAQWPQDIVVKPIEEIVTNTCTPKQPVLERKARPQKEQALNCPRCNSTNTKFCYYNNYSLTQPRYFCKTCRRYWTEGGSLRNIPVGGGSRKNKRPSSSSSSSKNNNKLPDLINTVPHQIITTTTTTLSHQGQDLNLAFPSTRGFANISELVQVPTAADANTNNNGSSNNIENDQIAPSSNNTSTNSISALELLTGMSSRGLNSFMHHMQPSDHHHQHQDPNNDNTVYTHGLIPMHDFKPSLNFSLDGINGSNGTTSGGYGNLHQGVQENSGRLLFPFEDLKQVSSTNHEQNINRDHHHHQQQGDSAAGYWTGMLGGGSW